MFYDVLELFLTFIKIWTRVAVFQVLRCCGILFFFFFFLSFSLKSGQELFFFFQILLCFRTVFFFIFSPKSGQELSFVFSESRSLSLAFASTSLACLD